MLTIYKASAGSGKTYTLTLEYIKLLLGQKDKDNGRTYYLNNKRYLKRVNHDMPIDSYRHRNILAITFTNKATEEMKTRIINELVAISQSSNGDERTSYVGDLMKIFPGADVDMLSETAKKALQELLVDFDNFNVSTIDSFFQQVLRSLAYELDYPGNYEVIINSDPVTAQAVDMMLDDLNYNPDTKHGSQLKDMLKGYMQEQYEGGNTFNIFNRTSAVHDAIVRSVGTLFNEKYQLIAEDFENWRKDNPDAIKNFGAQLKAWQKEMVEQNVRDANTITKSIETNLPPKAIDSNFLKLIERFKLPINEFLKYAKNAKSTLEKAREGSNKKLNKKFETEDNIALANSYGDMLREMMTRVAKYNDARTLYNEISTYSFMRYTSMFIEQIRADNNVVVLADTGELLHSVMKDESEVPFVYEKMGVNLHNFLIDEFQDTSQLQWDNLRELVFTGLSESDDSLIIGDEKQAIYRFRNSDSSMLHSTVAEEVDQRWHGHGDKLNELSSATNWRSSAEVVRFNNTFFGRMSKFHGIDSYQTVAQLVADKNKDLHGYVRFFNIPKEGIPDPLKPVPEDALEDFEPETIDQFEVMMREIRRQVEHGYSYGKIAVLVDTRNHGAEVVDHLLREKMPIITDEALMLNNCQSVRTVISIMQLLVNAKERSINDSPGTHKYKGFAAEQAGKFEYEYVKNLEAGMDKDKAVSEAINATFDDDSTDTGAIDDVTDIAEANPSTLYMLVETIINKRIPPEQRLHDLPYIAAFQDAVAEYTHNYSNNIVAFLKWWDTVKSRLSITSPDDVDAIKVMTIHKSKGLEFDCVHIPYGSWSLCGNESRSESVWITRESIINAVPDYVAAALPPHMRVTLNSTTADPFSMLNDHYTENMQARKVDGFNRTYVAYTRAKRELCVYYGEYEARGRGIGPDIKNIGGMPDYKAEEDDRAACEAGKIAPFNPDINIALEDYVDADGNIIIGEPTTYVAKEKAPKPVSVDAALEEFKKAMVSRYEVTLDGPGACITSVEPLLAECISDDIDDDPQDTARMQAMDRAAEHGERLHFMLSRINRKKDINRAVRFVRAIFHNDSLCDDAERELHRFFDNPDTAGYVKRWFEDHRRAINEMNIYDPDAPETESKVQRPDRIVWNEDGSIDIVDYKFGVKNPDHDTQVRRYINLLRRLYPNATINGWLWYAENHGKPAHVQPVAQ